MNVMIPGGCGYVGAMLVPRLIAEGHRVTVYDAHWFGDGYLPDHQRLRVFRDDLRNADLFSQVCEGQDAIIYLAGLTNNDLYERRRSIGDAVNKAIFPFVVETAKAAKIKRFIFASSVAAYGSSDHDATENDPLEPTTLYAKAKA